jgi:hypothetical protein
VAGVVGWGLCAIFIHATWVYAVAGAWALWSAISLARLQRRIGRAI